MEKELKIFELIEKYQKKILADFTTGVLPNLKQNKQINYKKENKIQKVSQ